MVQFDQRQVTYDYADLNKVDFAWAVTIQMILETQLTIATSTKESLSTHQHETQKSCDSADDRNFNQGIPNRCHTTQVGKSR